MTETPLEVSTATDEELLDAVRNGVQHAVVELWTRHYPATLATAKQASRQHRDAEEFASDAFSGMLAAIKNGGGPERSVRAYLLTAVRNAAAGRARRGYANDILTGDINLFETGATSPDPVARAVELGMMREAFAHLPRRWQTVLWRTAVDRESNVTVAEDMGISPNAVAALAKRARRRLRTAYLQVHASRGAVDPGCALFVPRLAQMVETPETAPADLRRHVAGCVDCTRRVAELRSVDTQLGAAFAPVLISAFPSLATAGGAAGAATSGSLGGSSSGAHGVNTLLLKWPLVALVAGGAAVGVIHWAAADVATPKPPPVSAPAPALETTPAASPPTTMSPATMSPTTPSPAQTSLGPSATSPRKPVPRRPTPSVTTPPAPAISTTRAAVTPSSPIPKTSSSSSPPPRPTPMSVNLQVSQQGDAVTMSVDATVGGTVGPLTLTLSVPTGVTLSSANGAWTQCAQTSATTVRCTAAHDASGSWSGQVHTAWPAGVRGSITATIRGTYANGAEANGSITVAWPP